MSGLIDFQLDARLDEVRKTLGFLPAALAAAIAEQNLDALSHHRKRVIKHHGFVAGNRAQRFIASRMFRYGSLVRSDQVTEIKQARGEGFFASRSTRSAGESHQFPLDAESVRRLEYGGAVRTSEPMAIPIGRGRPFKGVFQTVPVWRRRSRGLDWREFDIAPDPNDPKRSLILDARERSIRKAHRQGTEADLVVGVLVRSRRQEPKLEFFRQWQAIRGKHERRYEQAVDLAMTAAGRRALAGKTRSVVEARRAGRAAFEAALAADPRDFRGARQASRDAARAVRRRALSGGGR